MPGRIRRGPLSGTEKLSLAPKTLKGIAYGCRCLLVYAHEPELLVNQTSAWSCHGGTLIMLYVSVVGSGPINPNTPVET
jgi:hypothetical protein